MFDESVTEHFSSWADESVIETNDISDETELQNLVHLVEEVIGMPGAVNVHVVELDQWESVQMAFLMRRHRSSGAAMGLQVLRDPKNPRELFASQSMVAGLNEKPPSQPMVSQMVNTILAAAGPRLNLIFQRGATTLFGDLIQRQSHYRFYTGGGMKEATFVSRLIRILCDEYGFEPVDWLRELKARPDQFFMMLRTSKFWAYVIDHARDDAVLRVELAKSKHRDQDLIAKLTASGVQLDDHIVQFIDSLIDPFIAERDQQTQLAGSASKGARS